ncbi:MAG TPA: transglycosylase SLT domain-containing protein [Bacteroidia bacterium]|nr:transglycosylase SLT domain-containing protein [Bacteroidia bacterium]HNT79449.1 transglycosylase SLT domain-containing protein [Bacteroidia bacterium]
MRKFLFTGLLCLGVLLNNLSTAQVSSGGNSDDPIAEILDSLLSIQNVIRFNELNEFDHMSGLTSAPSSPLFSEQSFDDNMKKILTPIPMTYNDEVAGFIELYGYKKRNLTSRVMGLSSLYFPLFEQELDKEGLPIELKYLAIVESALNPIAVSRAGATGIWQFMYQTGKMYGLTINSYIDERRDPYKSTRAACQYFKDMYALYNDWLLVIASYNCGAGNVNKAIARSGGKTNFWEISRYLPRETRGYVPAFIAVTYLMTYHKEHNLYPVMPAYNFFEVDTLAAQHATDLWKISKYTGLPYDVVSYLNPIYKKGKIPNTDDAQIIRLPRSYVQEFIKNEANIYQHNEQENVPTVASRSNPSSENVVKTVPIAGTDFEYVYKKVKKYHYVKRGETLSTIGSKLKCSVSDLKSWNRIRGSIIHPGQKLAYYTVVKNKQEIVKEDTVAKATEEKETVELSDSKTSAQENPINNYKLDDFYIYHTVQNGDTLYSISKANGVSVEELKVLNNIQDSRQLKIGTKIKIKKNG